MNLRPVNGNVVIRLKKNFTELRTKSGIYLPNVEQDMNIAEVVAVPEQHKYIHQLRELDGTPIRNEDGSIKEGMNYVWVNLGDRIFFERRFHHDYSVHHRNRIDHTVLVDVDDSYEYFLIPCHDILGTYDGDQAANDVHGELYSTIAPKAVTASV